MKPIKRPLLVKAETLNIRLEHQPRGFVLHWATSNHSIKHNRRIKEKQVFRKLLLEVEDAVWVGRNAAVHKLSGRQSGSRWWATGGCKETKHRAAAIKRCECARVHPFKRAKIQCSVIRESSRVLLHIVRAELALLSSSGEPCRETMNSTFLAILQACVFTGWSRTE